jgi:DNA modification methylase
MQFVPNLDDIKNVDTNHIYNSDCIDIFKLMSNDYINFICIDPPYSDLENNTVLNNHKIQTKLDIPFLMSEFYRVLKNNSFFAFFGQMPTIVDWHIEALKAGFKFKKEIIWNKVNGYGRSNVQLQTIHENIYIYTKGSCNFYDTTDDYETITYQNIAGGLQGIDSILRKLSYYKGVAEGRDLKNSMGVEPVRKSYDAMYDTSPIPIRKKPVFGDGILNVKTIWSFLPHNKKHRNPEFGQIKHPTVKPIELLDRLIKLCSKESDIVLDCFLGSGTTMLSCLNTKRHIIGSEIYKEYFDIIKSRYQKNINSNKNIF